MGADETSDGVGLAFGVPGPEGDAAHAANSTATAPIGPLRTPRLFMSTSWQPALTGSSTPGQDLAQDLPVDIAAGNDGGHWTRPGTAA